MNNSHKFQNFRQLSNLFSQIWLKKQKASLFSGIWREIRKKSSKIRTKKCKSRSVWDWIIWINEYSLIQSQKSFGDFDEKIEIRERCEGVHCVDLGESFPTSIFLQNLASIQPRTSPKKFVSSSSREFEFKLWNFEPFICSPEEVHWRKTRKYTDH